MFTQYIFVILCLSQVVSCGGCSNFACTSTLRKTLLPPSAAVQIPLLGAEVDVLMQRRNTKVGNMYSTYDELYNERLTQNAICGRADVEAAIKNIQRFTLQLDRSDGRPDLSLKVVATKFNDFISTCLRTDGPAWTAAIGPLSYLGLQIPAFCTKLTDTGSLLPGMMFNFPKFCEDINSRLLDIPKEQVAQVLSVSEGDRNAVWDLSFVITRLALRYLIFEAELEGTEQTEIGLLSIKYEDENQAAGTLPSYILESILSIDMCVDYSVDISSKCFLVLPNDIQAWKKQNALP